MTVMNDIWIREQGKGMIDPFEPQQVSTVNDAPVISYGTSSYGYDIRASDDWKVFTNIHTSMIDPKCFDDNNFVNVTGKGFVVVPPNSFALSRSVEMMRVPRDVLVQVLGKSTYARCGIVVACTPLEPEWCGHITLEFSNTSNIPAKIYANEGVAQLLFLKGNAMCESSYADRQGKYQNQTGITLPK